MKAKVKPSELMSNYVQSLLQGQIQTDNFFVSIADNNDKLIKSFRINENYPNPFNPTTSIQFSVANTSEVQFTVFDLLGREVKQLFQPKTVYASGNHSLSLDFSGLPSGVYLVEAIGTEISSGIVTRQSVKVSLVK